MSTIYRIARYVGWPIITGLLAAAVIFLLFPQGLNNHSGVETADLSPTNLSSKTGNQWSGPASYAPAVRRASPSVVNLSLIHI